MADPAVSPGDTLGILGGGQLGRMIAMAAASLGLKSHVYSSEADSPAFAVADAHTVADYRDEAALARFAQTVAVVTYEFENIQAESAAVLSRYAPVRPNGDALKTSQDRLVEKQFLRGLGLETAPFVPVDDPGALARAVAQLGRPSILKTRRFGYDGKGQARLTSPGDAAQALADMNGAPAILEGFVDFTSEISVIAARGLDGAVACFDPGENVHRNGILHTTTVPARLGAPQRTDAVLLAARILNALDYVGVLGVELFVTPQGLIVNEIAPRVHNSGHWTQNGCAVDQFEQHIRAVAGWPLGDGSRHSDVTMENLIGEDIARVPALAAEGGTALHLYGKAETKPGRKMGHVNRIAR